MGRALFLHCALGILGQEVPARIRPSLFPQTTREYRIEFTGDLLDNSDFPSKSENALDWNYFERIQSATGNPWGYAFAANRQFTFKVIGRNHWSYKFNVQFNANSFKNDPAAPGQMDFALTVAELNQGLGFGLSDSFLNTAVVTKVTSNNCNFHQDGETVCGSLNLECIELDVSGNVECLSLCDEQLVQDTCGAHGTCTQTVSSINGSNGATVYNDAECYCSSDTWWSKGGEFGSGSDPCAPVLKNWLIIVIAVIAFLLLILIIIAVVYCCINGCTCPCKCATCCKKEDDIYQIKGSANPSFIPDNGAFGDTASSKAPLYSQYPLPEHKTVDNPAVWNDINPYNTLPDESFRTEAEGYDNTFPMVREKQQRNYASHDPRHHRSHRHESGSTARHKRRTDRGRRRSSDHSPTKKQLNTLEAEIRKLENDIEDMKTDMDTSRPGDNLDNSMSTVQAPIVPESNTAIDALQLSDEEVDQPLRKYESRTVLVETPQMPQNSSLPSSARTLNDTLKDRWRVPQLTVLPVDENPIRQIDSSVI